MKPHTQKLAAGTAFPALPVQSLDGTTVDISRPAEGSDWKLVIVYRGVHCPLCTRFLNGATDFQQRLLEIGVDMAAVSADSRQQLQRHREKLEVGFPLFHGLSLEQMGQLGLYISVPRSEQETDHLFPEPGLFVINHDGRLQVVDISNNPFVRPDMEHLVSGLEWIRNPENNYPIRGTHQ